MTRLENKPQYEILEAKGSDYSNCDKYNEHKKYQEAQYTIKDADSLVKNN